MMSLAVSALIELNPTSHKLAIEQQCGVCVSRNIEAVLRKARKHLFDQELPISCLFVGLNIRIRQLVVGVDIPEVNAVAFISNLIFLPASGEAIVNQSIIFEFPTCDLYPSFLCACDKLIKGPNILTSINRSILKGPHLMFRYRIPYAN